MKTKYHFIKKHVPGMISFFIMLITFTGKTNAQNTWQPVLQNSTSSEIWNFNEGSDGYFYVTERRTFLWRTANDGANWTLLPAAGYDPNFLGPNYFIATGKPGYIFVGSYESNTDMAGEGIIISTNNGSTWQYKNNGLSADTNIYNLFLMPNGNLLVHTIRYYSSSPTTRRLYLSTNNATSWQKVKDVISDFSEKAVSSSNEIYMVGTPSYKSTDNGLTWTQLSSGFDSYSISFAKNGNIYRSGQPFIGEAPVMLSTNNGTTWTKLACTGLRQNVAPGKVIITPNDTLFCRSGDSIL